MTAPLRGWLTVAVVAALSAASAQAGFVTPDSLASPPAVSPAVQGAAVAPNGWVTDQYWGAGVVFGSQMTGVDTGNATALIRVNGASVWTMAAYSDGFVLGAVSFVGVSTVIADLVVPGTTMPDVADSVQVKLLSAGNLPVTLTAYDKNGVAVASTTALMAAGGETFSLAGAGFAEVRATAFQPVIDPLACAGSASYVAWGVRSVAWANAPEPGGLLLAGLGVCGLLGYARKRRALGRPRPS